MGFSILKKDHLVELNPQYLVFKDHFVLCWAGLKKESQGKILYSRVDIELINEQTRLFYSALDEVEIEYNSQSFIITEYVQLGIGTSMSHYPLEKTIFHFKDNGLYDIASELLFKSPKYDQKKLEAAFKLNNLLLEKLENGMPLKPKESKALIHLPTSYLLCDLNGYDTSLDRLHKAKPLLRALKDKTPYIKLKETLRIMRKIKYS